MSNIVLSNLNSSKVEHRISEAYNADEVVGGFGFGIDISISNQTTSITTTVQNILNIDRNLPSLTTINQVAGIPGK